MMKFNFLIKVLINLKAYFNNKKIIIICSILNLFLVIKPPLFKGFSFNSQPELSAFNEQI